MIELAGFLTLIFIALAAFCVLALIGAALKLAFKLVLLPFALLGFVLKAVLVVVAVVIGLILAPVFMVVLGMLAAVVAVPLLLLAGLVSAGWALAT